MRHLLLVGFLVGASLLMGCATQNPIVMTAGMSQATITAPSPWWGEPSGYVSLDTPTTHTQAAYGVSKKGDVAIAGAAIGVFGGGAVAGPAGAAVGGIIGGTVGAYESGTTSDSLNSIAGQAARRRINATALPVE